MQIGFHQFKSVLPVVKNSKYVTKRSAVLSNKWKYDVIKDYQKALKQRSKIK